jgi:hypothetical protein
MNDEEEDIVGNHPNPQGSCYHVVYNDMEIHKQKENKGMDNETPGENYLDSKMNKLSSWDLVLANQKESFNGYKNMIITVYCLAINNHC